jgi:hypothetical protein
VILPILCAATLAEAFVGRTSATETRRVFQQQTRRGDTVLILSSWLHRSFPNINEFGLNWGMRHPMLWQIAAFYAGDRWRPGAYHELSTMSGAERELLDEIAVDFDRSRPVLLLVDNDPPVKALEGFDYVEYFSRAPRFARVLSEYDYLTRTTFHRVYRRRDGSPQRGQALPVLSQRSGMPR